MQYWEHQSFIALNQLDKTSFSEPLQKKITIFDKQLQQLGDTIEEDYEQLVERLQDLDLEILNDLQQEYEEQLENNELIEESQQNPYDEQILAKLYRAGQTQNLNRSFLKMQGIKADLTKNDTIQIGSYQLRRTAIFTYQYKLIKAK